MRRGFDAPVRRGMETGVVCLRPGLSVSRIGRTGKFRETGLDARTTASSLSSSTESLPFLSGKRSRGLSPFFSAGLHLNSSTAWGNNDLFNKVDASSPKLVLLMNMQQPASPVVRTGARSEIVAVRWHCSFRSIVPRQRWRYRSAPQQ